MSAAYFTRSVKLYLEYIGELNAMYDEWLEKRRKKRLPEHWARTVLQMTVSAIYAFSRLAYSPEEQRNIDALAPTWCNRGFMPLGYHEFLPMVKACQARCREIPGEPYSGERAWSLISRAGWNDNDIRPVSPSDRSYVGELDGDFDSVSAADVENGEGTASVVPDDDDMGAGEQGPDHLLEVLFANREASKGLFRNKGARQAVGKASLTSAQLREHNRELAGESGALEVEHGLRDPHLRRLDNASLALFTEACGCGDKAVIMPRSTLEDMAIALAHLHGEIAVYPASLKKIVDDLLDE